MARATRNIILYPDEDVDTGWTAIGGGGTNWETVDEGVSVADDDTTYVTTTTDLAVQTFGLQALPKANTAANFSMSVSIRYKNTSKWSDDTHQLRVRIMKGSTQITTQTINVVSTTYSTSTSVAADPAVALTASELADLRIELMFDRTVVGGNDSAGVQVTACELDLIYTPRATNIT